MTANRICRECGEVLHGRADKKFCDDQCRSNYNNKAANDNIAEVRSINSILRRNRKILGALTMDGKAKVSIVKLHDKGFNFRYHTHTYITQKGNVFKLCYEYAYRSLEKGFVIVVKWETG